MTILSHICLPITLISTCDDASSEELLKLAAYEGRCLRREYRRTGVGEGEKGGGGKGEGEGALQSQSLH
jgi:hypothetical protein